MYVCIQQLEIKDIPLQTRYNICLLNSVSDCANFINLTFNYVSFLYRKTSEHMNTLSPVKRIIPLHLRVTIVLDVDGC